MPRSPDAALVQRGRDAYARQAWDDAYQALSQADARSPLEPEDLSRLAGAAAMLGRDQEQLGALERAHDGHVAAGRPGEAARAAFWAGFRLLSLGEPARASGWFGRAERLRAPEDRALEGWLRIPEVYRLQRSGDQARAFELAAEAAAAGDACRDPDLSAFARVQQGASRLRAGRVREALALFDEAMLTATRHPLQPVVTGLVYCTVIAGCSRTYAVERARAWTGELSRWCQAQPQLVTFTGTCLVHRAELLEWDGSWKDAFEELRRVNPRDAVAVGAGHYQQGELHRLQGQHAAAEACYQAASRSGRDPQPGLALLRLAQGQPDAAARALERVLAGTRDPLQRTRYLPAQVEVLLRCGQLEGAGAAARELEATATLAESVALEAIAAHARGAVLLAAGKPDQALPLLRQALEAWLGLEAPYLAARVRVPLAAACLALGDAEGARLERDAARAVFAKLGAATDLAGLETDGRGKGRLSPRELEVLRLVAEGLTNGAIAARLGLSEKTVDRHLGNILDKLDVPSRAAATAHAFRAGLLGG